MNGCIHMSCKIRNQSLKALGIQVNPIDSLRRQPLNYVHN